ncbi:hypothetical protein SDC9_161064 [bioreactor metagenome]|uniref:Uncharacterized protein n=1 Tax=bioreactor metagenome TaxID=1076179 RepID=A0A645FIF4_9ZZZZ
MRDPYPLQQLPGLAKRIVSVGVKRAGQKNIFQNRQVLEGSLPLGNHADLTVAQVGAFRIGQMVQIPFIQKHRPLRRRKQACQQVE